MYLLWCRLYSTVHTTQSLLRIGTLIVVLSFEFIAAVALLSGVFSCYFKQKIYWHINNTHRISRTLTCTPTSTHAYAHHIHTYTHTQASTPRTHVQPTTHTYTQAHLIHTYTQAHARTQNFHLLLNIYVNV